MVLCSMLPCTSDTWEKPGFLVRDSLEKVRHGKRAVVHRKHLYIHIEMSTNEINDEKMDTWL